MADTIAVLAVLIFCMLGIAWAVWAGMK